MIKWYRIHLQCERPRLDPGLGRSPGEGSGNSLQYSCLGTPMDRGTCGLLHGVTKCQI